MNLQQTTRWVFKMAASVFQLAFLCVWRGSNVLPESTHFCWTIYLKFEYCWEYGDVIILLLTIWGFWEAYGDVVATEKCSLGSDRYMYRFLTCVHVTVTPWHGRDVHTVIFGSVTFLLWLQLLIGGWSHFYMFSSLLVFGVHYRRSLREELVNVWVGFIKHSYLVKVTIKVLVSC